jgi:DNA-directed RNA polymerase subunit beta'
VIVQDDEGKDLATYKLIQGAHLKIDEGDTIKRGQRLAEWDPYTRPILTEVDGVVDFEDLLEGLSVNEQTEETTGITHRVIIDWRAHPKGSALKPALVIKDKKGKVLKLTRGGEARYLLSVDAILSVEPGQKMKAGDVLARIPLESAKTRDITGGLPRVAELFEARRPKDHAIIAEMSGTVEFGRDYKNKRRITIVSDDEAIDPIEYLIPKGKHLSVQEGDRIEKGEFIMDGNPAPHDILAIKGVEELASYLVNEIQEVYRLQGVTINDKHIEVIVDQMLQKVEIEDAGETEFLKGEQIDRVEFEDANLLVEKSGRRPAKANPILLGITKASLQTRSFISAASFQETTRVLTDAAVNGKIDTLDGLKENVIVGRLIPAGTGGMISRLKKVAQHRDDLILEERSRAGNVEQSDEVAMPALTESQGAQAAE